MDDHADLPGLVAQQADRNRPSVPPGGGQGAPGRRSSSQAGARRVRAVLYGKVRSALMDLWLVRHGEAVPERQDPSRPLTPEGARDGSAIVESLAGEAGSFHLCAAGGETR